MCGRFKLTVPFSELVRLYGLMNNVNLRPRYNIAPTQDIAAVRSHADGRALDMLRWGLIPFWAKEKKIGYSTINAMAETITTKATFADAFKKRRCLIIADGFYEWAKIGPKERQPYLIQMRDRAPFAFAGLWERWKDWAAEEVVQSATIITTAANDLCGPIHDRMPAILAQADYAKWLGEQPATQDELQTLLKPFDAMLMEAVRIGSRIGNVKNDDAELITPLLNSA